MKKPILMVASYNGSADITYLSTLTDLLDVLVVNQFSVSEGVIELSENLHIHNSSTKGLSKNRNIGLSLVKGRSVIIADDDITYEITELKKLIEYLPTILSYRDFITFNNSHESGPRLPSQTHDAYSVFKVPSWCIVLSEKITEEENYFDENFGINAKYNSGEENIYLYDLVKKGYIGEHLYLHPVIHSEISTGFKWGKVLAKTKGAMLRRTFGGIKGMIILIIFMVKKLPSYFKNPSLIVYAMLEYIKYSGAR